MQCKTTREERAFKFVLCLFQLKVDHDHEAFIIKRNDFSSWHTIDRFDLDCRRSYVQHGNLAGSYNQCRLCD